MKKAISLFLCAALLVLMYCPAQASIPGFDLSVFTNSPDYLITEGTTGYIDPADPSPCYFDPGISQEYYCTFVPDILLTKDAAAFRLWIVFIADRDYDFHTIAVSSGDKTFEITGFHPEVTALENGDIQNAIVLPVLNTLQPMFVAVVSQGGNLALKGTSGSYELEITPGMISVFSSMYSDFIRAGGNAFFGSFNEDSLHADVSYGHVDDPVPSPQPTVESEPTAAPTQVPTAEPTAVPTQVPTAEPTAVPTQVPTAEPTAAPTQVPTAAPTAAPTLPPTLAPTVQPTPIPFVQPPNKSGSSAEFDLSLFSSSYTIKEPSEGKPGSIDLADNNPTKFDAQFSQHYYCHFAPEIQLRPDGRAIFRLRCYFYLKQPFNLNTAVFTFPTCTYTVQDIFMTSSEMDYGELREYLYITVGSGLDRLIQQLRSNQNDPVTLEFSSPMGSYVFEMPTGMKKCIVDMYDLYLQAGGKSHLQYASENPFTVQ